MRASISIIAVLISVFLLSCTTYADVAKFSYKFKVETIWDVRKNAPSDLGIKLGDEISGSFEIDLDQDLYDSHPSDLVWQYPKSVTNVIVDRFDIFSIENPSHSSFQLSHMDDYNGYFDYNWCSITVWKNINEYDSIIELSFQVPENPINIDNKIIFEKISYFDELRWTERSVTLTHIWRQTSYDPAPQLQVRGGLTSLIVSIEKDPQLVEIDIKPGSYPNCVNINGHGVVPVAILGSDQLDIADINPMSLSFSGLKVRVKGNKGPMCHFEDVSGDFTFQEGSADGILDLVCQFEDNSDYWVTGEGSVELTGMLYDRTPLKGVDSICIVP